MKTYNPVIIWLGLIVMSVASWALILIPTVMSVFIVYKLFCYLW